MSCITQGYVIMQAVFLADHSGVFASCCQVYHEQVKCYMQDTSVSGKQGVIKAVGTSSQSLACPGSCPPHKRKW